jgi:hypothetical protein
MRHAVGSKNMRVATGGSNINPVAEGSDSRSASNLEKSSSNVLKRNNGNAEPAKSAKRTSTKQEVSRLRGLVTVLHVLKTQTKLIVDRSESRS